MIGAMYRSHPQAALLRPSATHRTDAAAAFLPPHLSRRFGARLRTMLQQHSMLQPGIVSACGLDSAFLSEVEHGRRPLSLPQLQALALRLSLPLPELLGDL